MLTSDKKKRAADTKSFDEFLSDLSLRLLKVRAHNIDSEIRQSIREIGERYHIDKIDLRKFSEDRSATILLHWWVRSKDIGISGELRNEQLPWLTSLLLRGECIRIERLSDLPAEAASGRALLERDGLRAALIVPLMVDNQIYGGLLLASQEERDWSDEVVRESQLLGEALAVAYARAKYYDSLWTSAQRLRAVIENQTEFIVRWLPDGTRTWVNDRYCEFYQESRESIIGTSFLPLVVPADGQKLLNMAKAMTPDNPVHTADHQVMLSSGETGWQNWTNKGIFDASGKLTEIQSIGRDITDRKRAEDKYRTLFESANDAILLIKGERVTDCNRKALEVFHRDREDLIGKAPWDISIENQPDGSTSKDLGRAILKDAYSGMSKRFDWVHTRADGTPIDMEISLTPIELTHGGPQLLAVARDVTDAKRAQREIEHRAEFQTRLATLSSDLLRCSNNEIIELCRLALENIAKEYEFDSADIWWYPLEGETITRLAAWDRKEMPFPLPSDSRPKSQLSWSSPLLLAGETIKIEDVDCMPAESKSEQERLQGYGYKSLLSIPTKSEDEVLGSCVFEIATLERRKWPDEIVQELQLLGASLTNAITRYLAAKEISRREEFQRRLAELSTDLATALPDETSERLDQTLGRIGIDYGLDATSIRWISGEKGEMEGRAAWQREQDGQPLESHVSTSAVLPWMTSLILKGETMVVDDVNNMPDEAQVEQARWQESGLRSLLGFPMQVGATVGGAFFVATFEQRSWDNETIQELQLIADVLSGACARIWATEEILRREQDFAQSQEIARVGSYSFVPEGSYAGFPPKGKLELSPQFRELYGMDAGPASFEQLMSRIHPDDSQQVANSIKNAVSSGTRHVETYRVVRPDGTVLYLENRPHNVGGEAGHTNRIFGTVQDVTERIESTKKIEGALAEIEELKNQLQEENLYLREEIRAAHGFDKIIGDSPKLRKALMAAEKVAPTDVPVLILGETGTGKELIAQAIHDLSRCKDNALISINCAALSTNLIESELFGHEKGAFTGAHSRRKGRFELADGGTLFLDEIGELQGELQAKLLRVLQTGEFERLGGSTTLHVDVRLIAATNKNLERAVDKGEFRADLYYRINSFPIELPPLRERPEDIPVLAEFLVRKHAKRMGKNIESISARTIRYMTNQKWPGNVRELEGFIQRTLISTSGPVLDHPGSPEAELFSSPGSVPANKPANLRNVERQHILEVLKTTRWVVEGKRGAAWMMGVAPSTLRSKMKRLRIRRAP